MWQMILRKIIKVFAIRYQILRLKCTKINLGWGSGLWPRPYWGAYSAPQTPSWNKGVLLLRRGERGREGKGRRGREEMGGEGRREKEEERQGVEETSCASLNFHYVCIM